MLKISWKYNFRKCAYTGRNILSSPDADLFGRFYCSPSTVLSFLHWFVGDSAIPSVPFSSFPGRPVFSSIPHLAKLTRKRVFPPSVFFATDISSSPLFFLTGVEGKSKHVQSAQLWPQRGGRGSNCFRASPPPLVMTRHQKRGKEGEEGILKRRHLPPQPSFFPPFFGPVKACEEGIGGGKE